MGLDPLNRNDALAYVELVHWTKRNCTRDWTTQGTINWLKAVQANQDVDTWQDYTETDADTINGGPQLGFVTTTRYACLDIFLRSLCQLNHDSEVVNVQKSDIEQSRKTNARSILFSHIEGTFASGFLAVSEAGLLGVVPTQAQRGDKIAIFRGIQLPMIVRETDEAGEYMLVGWSWFLGLGNGEALESDAYQEREIVLV